MTTVFRQKDMQLQQLLREIRYVDICVAYQSGSFITQSMKTMKEMSTHDLDTLLLQSQSPTNLHESSDDEEEENIAVESTKYMLITDLI